MSNVRINLLPDDVKRRDTANRRVGLIVAGFLALIVAIGAVYWLQVMDVDDAQAEVDAEQAELQALQAELAELQEFADLQAERDAGNAVLQVAMGGEASTAGILQDVASVMPPDAQLDTLTITITEPTPAELGDVRDRYGSMTMTGQTRLGHAPGLERFLLEFDKIAAFTDLFFSNSTIDDRGVSTFNAEIDLGAEVLTGRYANGLPEALR